MDTNFIEAAEKHVKSFQENQQRNREVIESFINSINKAQKDITDMDDKLLSNNNTLSEISNKYSSLDILVKKSLSTYDDLIQSLNNQVTTMEKELKKFIVDLSNESTIKLNENITTLKSQFTNGLKVFEENIQEISSKYEKETQFSLKIFNNTSKELSEQINDFTNKGMLVLTDYIERSLEKLLNETKMILDENIVSKYDELIAQNKNIQIVIAEGHQKAEKRISYIEDTLKSISSRSTVRFVCYLLISIFIVILLVI